MRVNALDVGVRLGVQMIGKKEWEINTIKNNGKIMIDIHQKIGSTHL
jgi:hypothetical protein